MSYADDGNGPKWAAPLLWTVLTLVVVSVLVGMLTLWPIYSRYQARADRNQHRSQLLKDAKNDVTINSIRIRTQAQKVKIAQQDAQIRYVKSVGIRRSQDEISKTLTPLYVQFEMIDALEKVAASGRNSTVIYIPTGSNGLPITATSNVPTKP